VIRKSSTTFRHLRSMSAARAARALVYRVHGCLKPWIPTTPLRKLFRSEYQQGDSEDNQQMHRVREDPSNLETIVSVDVTFFEW